MHAKPVKSSAQIITYESPPPNYVVDEKDNNFGFFTRMHPRLDKVKEKARSALQFTKPYADNIKRHDYPRWRICVVGAAAATAVVLAANVIVTIWVGVAVTREEGIGVVRTGTCLESQRINQAISLVINILSSILLGASNYCMQLLSAPTRADVDKAHSNLLWLDIGIPSVRNLKHIAWSKILLWWLLGLSSVPLHLSYNSVFFSSIMANAYTVAVVTPQFLMGAHWDTTAPFKAVKVPPDAASYMQKNFQNFERLEKVACTQAYYKEFISSRRDLIVVTKPGNSSESTNSVLGGFNRGSLKTFSSQDWMCKVTETPSYGRPKCALENVLDPKGSWILLDREVDYCLSEAIAEKCKLHFSFDIVAVVIVCNVLKLVAMCLIVWKPPKGSLVTIGDAMASFLQIPDQHTSGMCLISKEDVVKGAWKEPPAATVYRPQKRRWLAAASRKRWLVMNSLFACPHSISSLNE
ncbi:MAG: hypothetical protein M1833_000418 [Piccolia ochrophora]|nr:MAG: hypothetical protein M1833_000418 [Piccolia ochrophora]